MGAGQRFTSNHMASTLQVGDRVMKLKGVDSGQTGVVDEVVADVTPKVRVRHWKTPTESIVWKLQAVDNYRLADAADEMPAEAEGGEFVTPPTTPRQPSPPNSPPLLERTRAMQIPPLESISNSSETPRLRQQHTLNVGCWNGHQLSFLKCENGIPGWLARTIVYDWNLDVLMISEVPLRVGLERVQRLCDLLNLQRKRASGGDSLEPWEYEMHHSECSGVQTATGHENRQEYHVALVRSSLVIEATHTHKKGESNVPLEYAPYTIFLRDERFIKEACKRIAITSVHLPPDARRRARNTQGNVFLRSYRDQMDWPEPLKKDRPFSFTSMNNKFCTHIIGGDFNCVPFSTLTCSIQDWWQAFDEEVTTSSGGKAYDNWLVNRSAVEKVWLDVRKNVGRLPLDHHGGLSDHDVVILELVERPLRRRC